MVVLLNGCIESLPEAVHPRAPRQEPRGGCKVSVGKNLWEWKFFLLGALEILVAGTHALSDLTIVSLLPAYVLRKSFEALNQAHRMLRDPDLLSEVSEAGHRLYM